MSNILTIPKRMRGGDLVIVLRKDYEETLKIQARLLREEADTDDAIGIFHSELRSRKLKTAKGFADIVGKKR
jgi:hypothetical protein